MKKLGIISCVISLFLPLILFVTIFISDEEDSASNDLSNVTTMNLSAEVLAHRDTVQKYCDAYGISEYVYYVLAIMQVESKGVGEDVMQASESLGLPPNSLSKEESIKQGCKYFSELLQSSNKKGCDIDSVIQAYNCAKRS